MIDAVIDELTCSDPASRMSAQEALDKLGNMIHSRSPALLLIRPEVIRTEC